jgi:hypothetical protein
VLAYSHPQRGQQDTDTVLKRWCSMFDYAYERVDSPVFVSVVHPQVIGQGHHMLMYEQFVEYIAGKEGVWFATCERSPTPGSPMTMIAGSSTCPTCAALRPLHPTLDGASPELSPGLIADAGSPSQGLPVTTGESCARAPLRRLRRRSRSCRPTRSPAVHRHPGNLHRERACVQIKGGTAALDHLI